MAGKKQFKKVHMVGIGGAGMSALAEILLSAGIEVSGSDKNDSSVIRRLKGKGAKINIGHSADNITDNDLIVYSSAISRTNPEMQAALKKNILVIHRSDLLNLLSENKKSVFVSGCHGKTTTTALLSLIMEENGRHPTCAIGGELIDYPFRSGRSGAGDIFIAEADESDGSFIKYNPYISVITNIEYDHMSFYRERKNLHNYYRAFAEKALQLTVFNRNDMISSEVLSGIPGKTFGYEDCNMVISDLEFGNLTSRFKLCGRAGRKVGFEIWSPGKVMAENTAAACLAAEYMDVDLENSSNALRSFRGLKRRFELIGKYNGVTLIEDYSHHPTEIAVTLEALKASLKNTGSRLLAVFQPHRYTRTLDMWKEFALSFGKSDYTVFTDVYSAFEEPIEGIDGALIFKEARKIGLKCDYVQDMGRIPAFLKPELRENDYLIILGAGNINEIKKDLIRDLQN
ncbi:MAG: UDP-N-acetylmuramate--L-alanine ligase [Candidatus Aureabacteria bacterium]|nr:UDP-N-acetylmuramate--L-alanine ligase [Candidatus Auribacterota bacterium]